MIKISNQILKSVDGWMRYWGWSHIENGACKYDEDGRIIARHGDGVWNKDVTCAILICERDDFNNQLMDEIERTL